MLPPPLKVDQGCQSFDERAHEMTQQIQEFKDKLIMQSILFDEQKKNVNDLIVDLEL